jgi:hypothetical protein
VLGVRVEGLEFGVQVQGFTFNDVVLKDQGLRSGVWFWGLGVIALEGLGCGV